MNKQELETLYKQAGLLYLMKEYTDALEILDDLLKSVPGNAEVLIAKCKCLIAVDRREEARLICRQIMTSHNDSRAVAILSQLEAPHAMSLRG